MIASPTPTAVPSEFGVKALWIGEGLRLCAEGSRLLFNGWDSPNAACSARHYSRWHSAHRTHPFVTSFLPPKATGMM